MYLIGQRWPEGSEVGPVSAVVRAPQGRPVETSTPGRRARDPRPHHATAVECHPDRVPASDQTQVRPRRAPDWVAMAASTSRTTALIQDLQGVLGAERVRAEPTELGLYRRDASTITG